MLPTVGNFYETISLHLITNPPNKTVDKLLGIFISNRTPFLCLRNLYLNTNRVGRIRNSYANPDLVQGLHNLQDSPYFITRADLSHKNTLNNLQD